LAHVSISAHADVVAIGNEYISLEYDLATARFTIRRPDGAYPLVANACVGAVCQFDGQRQVIYGSELGPHTWQQSRVHDVHGMGWQLVFHHAARSEALALTWTVNAYEEQPFLLFKLAAHNRGGRQIHVHEMILLDASPALGGKVAFGDVPRALDFFKAGWHAWPYTGLRHARQKDVNTRLGFFVRPFYFNPTTLVSRRRGDFWGEGWGVLTDQKVALVAGLVSRADQFGQVHVHCQPGRGLLSIITQADGILVPPRECVESEWGMVQFVSLPHPDPLADYVAAVARQMDARVSQAPPPVGWCSWYPYFDRVTEADVLANLEAADRLDDVLPMRLIQLDDGYQSAWGDWTTCNERFPNGLASLASQIALRERRAGLWLAPFVLSPRSDLVRQHPDWLVRDARNRPIHSGLIWRFFGRALDTTHPAVLDWTRALMRQVVQEWGFTYLKLDWLYAAALPGRRHDPQLTRAQALRKGLQAIREGAGEDAFLLGCGCPFGPAVGIVDGMRIGPDVAPHWYPDPFHLPIVRRLVRREMSLPAARNNVRHTLNLSALHRHWWWNDPDCLLARGVDTRLTPEEVRSLVSVIGLSGGMVVDSDDLTRLSPERQRWTSAIFPILSEGARPLDLLEREMAELYDLPMVRPWKAWHVVGVFNWSARPVSRALDLACLGFDGAQPTHVFDFWKGAYQLCQSATLELGELPGHGCRVLRLCAHDASPCIVGDTMHITQGGQVGDWRVVEDELQFSICDLGRKAEGEIWLWLPGERVEATCEGQAIPVQKRQEGIWALALAVSGPSPVTVRWGV
jgi:alpha-galactosidase